MASIKFDREKANNLVKELTRFSTDIESNLSGIKNTVTGREISLNDSRLKVYGYRDKTIEITQDDGTIVEETVREKYLKHNYTSYAKTYNANVTNLYNKANSASTNATKAIEKVINSLNKINSLIEEFETDTTLRMSYNLDAVGAYNFNFLSAYGPVSSVKGYSPTLGAIVTDEAYASQDLGPLGSRPSVLNVQTLDVFDGVLDIARNNTLSYDDKIHGVEQLLIKNNPNIDINGLNDKAVITFNNMIGIADKPDELITSDMKVNFLIENKIDILDKPVSTDSNVDVTNKDSLISGIGVIGGAGIANQIMQLPSRNEAPNLKPGGGVGGGNAGNIGAAVPQPPQVQKPDTKKPSQPKKKDTPAAAPSTPANELPKVVDTQKDSGTVNVQPTPSGQSNPANTEVIQATQVTENKPVNTQPLAADAALEEDLKAASITTPYTPTNTNNSTTIGSADVHLPDPTEVKGAGVAAGLAGAGALGNLVGNTAGTGTPMINGMAAGELLGGTPGGVGMMPDAVVNAGGQAGALSGTPTINQVNNSMVGGESTSDRGIVNKNRNAQTASGKSSGGGSTLEDKKQESEKNSYGKSNKPGEDDSADKKGMLGDASIAELDAKDEKQIKVATGVSAGGALGSAVLAIAGILPSLMFILVLLAIIALYTTYRVKKKHDKKKRMAALAAKQASAIATADQTSQQTVVEPNQVNNSVNVTQSVQSNTALANENVNEAEVKQTVQSVQQSTQTNNDAFSEHPYEPSRDGMTDIGTTSDNT